MLDFEENINEYNVCCVLDIECVISSVMHVSIQAYSRCLTLVVGYEAGPRVHIFKFIVMYCIHAHSFGMDPTHCLINVPKITDNY